MKTLKTILLLLISCSIVLISCRTEDDLAIDPPAEEAIVANSTLANLISRTSQNDGSFDNIIDNASCLSIELPVTVIANETVVVVNSSSDYQIIEDIFDASNDDVDTLDIIFPITVVFADYSTTEVNSYPELLALITQCPAENSNDDDIECIDFQYPISASVFDQNNDLIDTIVITNDVEMYIFIENLDDFAAVTINFPITVTLADGSNLSINSISELEATIEDADDTCDEDDDNDYNDDDCNGCTSDDIETTLVSCLNWSVDELELNDIDLEDQYDNYIFNFDLDGTITVTEGTNTLTGSWSITGTGNNIEFVIDIPSLPDFNGTWNVEEIEVESGETEIKLEKADDDELEFKSNC